MYYVFYVSFSLNKYNILTGYLKVQFPAQPFKKYIWLFCYKELII